MVMKKQLPCPCFQHTSHTTNRDMKRRTWTQEATSVEFGTIETGEALDKWITFWMTFHNTFPRSFPLYMARYYCLRGVRSATHAAIVEYYHAHIKTFHRHCRRSRAVLINMGSVLTYIQIKMKTHDATEAERDTGRRSGDVRTRKGGGVLAA